MEDAVRYYHHGKGNDPAGKCDAGLRPAIVRRDGDEPGHPLPEPGHNAHVEQAHDADDVAVGCFNGAFWAVVHATHAAFAAV